MCYYLQSIHLKKKNTWSNNKLIDFVVSEIAINCPLCFSPFQRKNFFRRISNGVCWIFLCLKCLLNISVVITCQAMIICHYEEGGNIFVGNIFKWFCIVQNHLILIAVQYFLYECTTMYMVWSNEILSYGIDTRLWIWAGRWWQWMGQEGYDTLLQVGFPGKWPLRWWWLHRKLIGIFLSSNTWRRGEGGRMKRSWAVPSSQHGLSQPHLEWSFRRILVSINRTRPLCLPIDQSLDSCCLLGWSGLLIRKWTNKLKQKW